jgi:acetylornithine deacetylase/succinyl-diaminopimelate desuccinylase-like protein
MKRRQQMYTLLRRKNQGLKDDVLEFTRDLVRTPSESLAEGELASTVETRMKEVGWDKVFRDDAGNVVGVMLGLEAQPTVLLNCHMDTVAHDQEGEWGESPYSGRMEGAWIHGLGAADCKGGLAAQIYAGALLKRSLLPLRGNIVMAATAAEENGLSIGVRALIEKTLPELDLKPDFAILGEPTGLGLYYGHDGWLEMEIRVEGANPFHVDDAARAIVDDFRSGDGGDADSESQSSRRPRFEETGGLRRATIMVNRRLHADEDAASVVGQTRRAAIVAAQSSGSVAVEVLVRQDNQKLYTGQTTLVKHVTHSWTTDPFHPFLERARQSLSAAGCQARPGKWQLGRLGMGTAGSVLMGEFGVATIGYGPGEETFAHTTSERVDSAKIVEAVYGTAAIAHGLVGIPTYGWTSDEI